MTALLELGSGVGSPDADAAHAARAQAAPGDGRLAELVEWLAATQGKFPPVAPERVRCIVLGPVTDAVGELAAASGVGVRTLVPLALPADALAAGAEAADREIDSGADLVVLAGGDHTVAPAVLVSLLTGAEPVALLPRGPEATDSAAWIGRAAEIRDTRRRLTRLRTRPDELISGLGSALIATAAGFVLRAATRRTGVLLDGSAVLAAALLGEDVQSRAREWWQVADRSPERAHARAVEQLGLHPLLDLGTSRGDGLAGVLAVATLQAAVITGAAHG